MAPHGQEAFLATCSNPNCRWSGPQMPGPKCRCGFELKWIQVSNPYRGTKRSLPKDDDQKPEKQEKSSKRLKANVRNPQQPSLPPSDKGNKLIQPPVEESEKSKQQKTKKEPSLSSQSWCFNCHVGSHWTRKCSGNLAPLGNLVELGWDVFKLNDESWATLKSIKPRNSQEFMEHLWRMAAAIEDFNKGVENRDALMKRISQDNTLLQLLGVRTQLHKNVANEFERVCALANRAASNFVRWLASEIRDLFTQVIRIQIFPDADRSKWASVQKKAEAIACCNKITVQEVDPPINDEIIEGFRKKLDELFGALTEKTNLFAQDWRNALQQSAIKDLPEAEQALRLRIRNLPVEEFRAELYSDSTQSWLPMLRGPNVKTEELENIIGNLSGNFNASKDPVDSANGTEDIPMGNHENAAVEFDITAALNNLTFDKRLAVVNSSTYRKASLRLEYQETVAQDLRQKVNEALSKADEQDRRVKRYKVKLEEAFHQALDDPLDINSMDNSQDAEDKHQQRSSNPSKKSDLLSESLEAGIEDLFKDEFHIDIEASNLKAAPQSTVATYADSDDDILLDTDNAQGDAEMMDG